MVNELTSIIVDVVKIKELASNLFAEASLVTSIANETEYEFALELMDELIDDYDAQKPLIDLLSNSIERWENSSSEFAEFNARSRP